MLKDKYKDNEETRPPCKDLTNFDLPGFLHIISFRNFTFRDSSIGRACGCNEQVRMASL
jgi:hypothetical protein